MESKTTTAVFAALTLALTCSAAGAATAQDASLRPRFGEVDLEAGFRNDPYRVQVTAGGRYDAGDLGRECVGMISDEPTFRLNYDASQGVPLYFFAYSDSDLTLIVNEPNGSWNCNDDGDGSGGTNPGIRFRRPASGVYDIWVGNLSGGRANARLAITEVPPGSEHQGPPPRRSPPPRRGPNRNNNH